MKQTPPAPPGWKAPINRTMPPPPDHVRTELPTPPTHDSVTSAPPPVGPVTTVNGRLSNDETSFILDTTLLPIHRDDPNILRFIASYVRCRDARQAAREAGIQPNKGSVLRSRPDIYQAIVKLSDKSVSKYGYDAHEVIEKVKEIVGVDPIEFERPDGSFKKLSEMEPEVRRAIKKFKLKNFYEKDANGMEVLRGEVIEIELYDKMKASELLGSEKDLFKKTTVVEHGVTTQMADILLESKQRAGDALKRLSAGPEAIDVTPVRSDE